MLTYTYLYEKQTVLFSLENCQSSAVSVYLGRVKFSCDYNLLLILVASLYKFQVILSRHIHSHLSGMA